MSGDVVDSDPGLRVVRSAVLSPNTDPASPDPADIAGPLNTQEVQQLRRLRRWGTVGALLMMVGAASSYGAANPVPNPADGIRIFGLMSRVGPAALHVSYTGIGLLVLSWYLLGRLAAPGRPRRLSRTQLTHTLVMWTVPFLITPPIFSRDSYSYLAIGSMMVHGFNPYEQGPYDALSDSNPYAHQVDGFWQHTTSPYGPFFLLVVKAIVGVVGNHVVLGVLIQRLVELFGIALILWALPRLALRCRIDPVSALWLGALNPLLLFHLIAGAHNEALMLGLMLGGLELGLRSRDFTGFRPDWRFVGGVTAMTLAVGVKATAGISIAFLVIMLARRQGAHTKDLLRLAALALSVVVAVFAVLTATAGVGLGWLSALGTPGLVRSWLSPSTDIGTGAGFLGTLLGLGDHTSAVIDAMRQVSTGVGAILAIYMMWRAWRGRVEPIRGLGLALGVFVLLGPVIQPWYLLWAAIPLAASTAQSRYRRITIWITAGTSVVILPNGSSAPVYTILQAVGVMLVVLVPVLLIQRRFGIPTATPDIGRRVGLTTSGASSQDQGPGTAGDEQGPSPRAIILRE